MARRGRPELLDQLREAAKLDARLRQLAAERNAARARVNELSKQVGERRRAGDIGAADELAARSRALGEQEKQLDDEHDLVSAELRDLLLTIPNLPHPDAPHAADSTHPPADLAEIVRLYGLRPWIEQSYKQVKNALGWAHYQVRKDISIRRHWQLVCCAFSFCWWAWSRAPAAFAIGLTYLSVHLWTIATPRNPGSGVARVARSPKFPGQSPPGRPVLS